MGQRQSSAPVVQGTVEPGFESVREMFARNFARGAEESAQLCVYVGEARVVDLWCSTSDPGYTADTLTTQFSLSKKAIADLQRIRGNTTSQSSNGRGGMDNGHMCS